MTSPLQMDKSNSTFTTKKRKREDEKKNEEPSAIKPKSAKKNDCKSPSTTHNHTSSKIESSLAINERPKRKCNSKENGMPNGIDESKSTITSKNASGKWRKKAESSQR